MTRTSNQNKINCARASQCYTTVQNFEFYFPRDVYFESKSSAVERTALYSWGFRLR